MRYRKKPVVIEARRFNVDGSNGEEVAQWCKGKLCGTRLPPIEREIRVETNQGEATAMPGDWIIRGIGGECYPCRNEVFEATYEPEFHSKSEQKRVTSIMAQRSPNTCAHGTSLDEPAGMSCVNSEVVAHVFLHRRPLDKQAWPVIYQDKDLAEKCAFRVSAIVEVVLPPEKVK